MKRSFAPMGRPILSRLARNSPYTASTGGSSATTSRASSTVSSRRESAGEPFLLAPYRNSAATMMLVQTRCDALSHPPSRMPHEFGHDVGVEKKAHPTGRMAPAADPRSPGTPRRAAPRSPAAPEAISLAPARSPGAPPLAHDRIRARQLELARNPYGLVPAVLEEPDSSGGGCFGRRHMLRHRPKAAER